ncbi:MAG: hypothetical protein HUK04_08035 [Bacteroidaceae bacterium]|nr:hypothetical protein [Bacteroidaceae bacterium]
MACLQQNSAVREWDLQQNSAVRLKKNSKIVQWEKEICINFAVLLMYGGYEAYVQESREALQPEGD